MNSNISYLFILISALLIYSCNTEMEKSKEKVNAISVGKGPDALFLTPDANFLYVANVEDTFISVIDTRKDSVVKTIDVTDYPWGFTRLGKSNLVAVSGYDNGIDVIDFTQHKIVRSKRYDSNLGGVTSSSDGKYLFVVAITKKEVWKIDTETLDILEKYQTGNGPDGIGISFDGNKVYVTNTEDGTISVINLKNKTSRLLKTGGKPELVHANHDRSRLFISNFNNNMVHIINTKTDEIIHEISGLKGPEEAVLSKSEKTLYVVNFNSKKVYAYNAETFSKLQNDYTTGEKPIGLVSAKNDSVIYVSNYGDNSISIIKIH